MTLYNGRYTIEEHIADGGFATLHRAAEEGREEKVAIKIGITSDDPAYAESIRKEAKIIQRFSHSNIVRLYPIPREEKTDVDFARAIELEGSPYFFVMEYLAGGTLETYLRQVGPLAPEEAAAVGVEIARGLDHMHQRTYAHNDLKLENIMFRHSVVAGQPFDVVLIDFGIARRAGLQTDAGSMYIMSPEQLKQAKMLNAPEEIEGIDRMKVDVWGLGIVLYRMLGGRLPFTARNERSLTERIFHARPTTLQRFSSSVSSELDKLIIDGCLAKKPEYRLSLLDVGRRLSALGQGIVASKSSPLEKPSRRWRFGRS